MQKIIGNLLESTVVKPQNRCAKLNRRILQVILNQ